MSADFLNDLFGLHGQTAVVIGGGGVLGGALCRGLAQAGAHVIVADLKEEQCKAVAAQVRQCGGQAGYCAVDVASRESIEKLLAATLAETGRADILVNCAGVNAGSSFLDATEADWDRVMSINLKAVFMSCQVFARHMVSCGGGAIVNIGSVSSHLPLSRVFAYSASKAGVLSLTRNIAQEFGGQGVRVERDLPRLLPRRAESPPAGPGADPEHHASHADAAFWRAGGIDRRTVVAGFAQGRQFHYRDAHQRGWRFHGRVVLGDNYCPFRDSAPLNTRSADRLSRQADRCYT